MIDRALVAELFRRAGAIQERHDGGPIEPLKRAAKRVCTDLLSARLPAGARILDVGGEEFYHGDLTGHQITVANLPDQDMHALTYREAFDAVIAMHVLEHSPFPLYVLALLHRALVPGGILYVAVPRPCDQFCTGFGHWSVMPALMWRRLLEASGFTVESATTGQCGAKPDWTEERFLCRRTP